MYVSPWRKTTFIPIIYYPYYLFCQHLFKGKTKGTYILYIFPNFNLWKWVYKHVYIYVKRMQYSQWAFYNLMQNDITIVVVINFCTYLNIIIWSVSIRFWRTGSSNTTEGWISIFWSVLERKRQIGISNYVHTFVSKWTFQQLRSIET